jgi:excisionase family DNA binding protein
MESERRAPSSAERRRIRAAEVHSVSSHSDGRFSRRIGPVWLSVAQLCHRWQLSRKTIYKFIDAGILPAWKVGPHLYRVAIKDVLRFEAELPPMRSEDHLSFPPND